MKLFENLILGGVIFLKDGIARTKVLLMRSWGELREGQKLTVRLAALLSLQGLDDTERGSGGFGSTGKN